MSKKKSSNAGFRKEEIRGLFVLGLLAVLSSIRVQNETMMVSIGQISINIIPFLDITIILWSFYAFFMVFGLSEDMIGRTASNVFREAAKAFLYFNFLILAFLSLLLGYFGYPTRLPWALGLLSILILYALVVKLREIRRRKSIKFNLKEIIKSNLSPLLSIVTILCFAMIMFSAYEQYVIPFFVIGCVTIVIWLFVSEKKRL